MVMTGVLQGALLALVACLVVVLVRWLHHGVQIGAATQRICYICFVLQIGINGVCASAAAPEVHSGCTVNCHCDHSPICVCVTSQQQLARQLYVLCALPGYGINVHLASRSEKSWYSYKSSQAPSKPCLFRSLCLSIGAAPKVT
jgi:hypothetical protein